MKLNLSIPFFGMCLLALMLASCGTETVNRYEQNTDLTIKGISNPMCMILTDNGTIYVTNVEGNTVDVFVPDGSGQYTKDSTKTLKETIVGPVGIAIYHDTIFVSNYNNNTISAFVPDGKGNYAYDSVASIPKKIIGPQGLWITPDGTLFVSGFNTNEIFIFERQSDGTYQLNKERTVTDGVMVPTNVMVAPNGTLFVCNWGGNTITQYEPKEDGKFVLMEERTLHSGMADPYGLALDENGNLYVANYTLSKITGFRKHADGHLLYDHELTITKGVNVPVFLHVSEKGTLYSLNYGGTITQYQKEEIARDSIKIVYIPDMSKVGDSLPKHNIEEFPGLAKKVPNFTYAEDLTITDQVMEPQNLKIGPDNLLYVTNFATATINVYQKEKSGKWNFLPGRTISKGLSGLCGIQFDNRGYLYANNFYTNSVTVYIKDKKGNYKYHPELTIATGLNGPFSSTMSADGKTLYSPNFNNNTITIVKQDDMGKWAVTQTITDTSYLGAPTALEIDPNDGTMYVCNLDIGIVAAFDPEEDGKYTFSQEKSFKCFMLDGRPANIGPYRLLIKDDVMYITNFNSGTVYPYVKTPDGYYVLAKDNVMHQGIIGASGIDMDEEGNLIIGSYGINKIVIYKR